MTPNPTAAERIDLPNGCYWERRAGDARGYLRKPNRDALMVLTKSQAREVAAALTPRSSQGAAANDVAREWFKYRYGDSEKWTLGEVVYLGALIQAYGDQRALDAGAQRQHLVPFTFNVSKAGLAADPISQQTVYLDGKPILYINMTHDKCLMVRKLIEDLTTPPAARSQGEAVGAPKPYDDGLFYIDGDGQRICFEGAAADWSRISVSFEKDDHHDVRHYLRADSVATPPYEAPLDELREALAGFSFGNNVYQIAKKWEQCTPLNISDELKFEFSSMAREVLWLHEHVQQALTAQPQQKETK